MNPFSSTEKILKHIHDNGAYVWKPITLNSRNSLLYDVLNTLSDEGFLHRKDSGWLNMKTIYTITDKGIEYIKDK